MIILFITLVLYIKYNKIVNKELILYKKVFEN